ncbi:MAG: hypothetical protein JO279_09115 [Verrucomicrobia bacterium]|nr:hypothetical protein [Verrucomicrobiota bacterium]
MSKLKRESDPGLWAATVDDVGTACDELGIRTEGPKATEYLAKAVAADRSALEVFTPQDLPQQWAMTQNNLGIALQEQGIRGLPFPVPTLWFCYFCGETHERVTNCACGKCVEFYGTKCDGATS